MSTKLQIPQGVKAEVAGDRLIVTGPKGIAERKYPTRNIQIKISGGELELITDVHALENTFAAHIKNMFRGVQEPFVYKLKISYIHFPMTVSLQNSEFSVTNFLGERRQRRTKLPEGAEVKIDGDFITITSPNIELAGKAATLIEQLTRVRSRDRRTFLDGIYMVEKAGVPVTT